MSFFTFASDFCGAKGCDIGGESLNWSSTPHAVGVLFSTGLAVVVFSTFVVAPAAAHSQEIMISWSQAGLQLP